MGFARDFMEAVSGGTDGEPATVAGRQLVCPHCGHNRFYRSKARINIAGTTFLGSDWASRPASVFECTSCGRLEWFASSPKRAEREEGKSKPAAVMESSPCVIC